MPEIKEHIQNLPVFYKTQLRENDSFKSPSENFIFISINKPFDDMLIYPNGCLWQNCLINE